MTKLLIAASAALAVLLFTLATAVPAQLPPEAPAIKSWRALNLAHGSLSAEVAELRREVTKLEGTVAKLEARISELDSPHPKLIPLTQK